MWFYEPRTDCYKHSDGRCVTRETVEGYGFEYRSKVTDYQLERVWAAEAQKDAARTGSHGSYSISGGGTFSTLSNISTIGGQ